MATPAAVMSIAEMHSWLIGKVSPHHTAFKIGFSEQLHVSKLKQAIWKVAQRQPKIHYRLRANNAEFFTVEEKIKIHVLKKKNWLKTAEKLLATSFSEQEPLFRFYIFDHEKTDMLLVFHHSISDGMSGIMFCQQILEHYHDAFTAKFLARQCLPFKTRTIDFKRRVDEIKESNSLNTGLHTFTISSEASKKILTLCQQQHLSLSQIFGAAAVRANHKHLSQTDCVNCFYPIDLRKDKHQNAEELDYCTGWLEFNVEVTEDNDLLTMARLIHKHLSEQIKRKQALKNFQTLESAMLSKTPAEVIANTQRQAPTVVVTGIDNLSLFSDMPIHDVHMMVNCQAYLANNQSFMLTFNHCHDTIFCTLMYVKEQITQTTIHQIAVTIQTAINQLLKDTNETSM